MIKSITAFLDENIAKCVQCPLHNESINSSKGKMLGYGTGKYIILGLAPSWYRTRVGGYAPYSLESDIKDAHHLFWKCLENINWPIKETYYTNLLKCSLPNNRSPLKNESSTCINTWLTQEIAIIIPRFIICLGNVAFEALEDSPFASQFPIKKVFHPSYVVRTPGEYNKWEDQWIKILREK